MTREILALPMECWRWIPGYEDIAQVSTMGNVKTVGRWVLLNDGRKHFRKERILKQTRNKEGYLRVGLSRNGKKRRFLVHRLVAETWLDNPENKPQVHHRNEQKDMNFVENLSWATAKENSNWGTRNKRRADKLSKAVEALDPKTGQVAHEFPSTMEAGRKGFDSGSISACCLGRQKSHKGYIWRYKDDHDQENAWTSVKIGAASLSKAVQAIDPNTGLVVMEFPSTMEAERNGFSSTHISRCCLGKQRTHRGLIWRYKE